MVAPRQVRARFLVRVRNAARLVWHGWRVRAGRHIGVLFAAWLGISALTFAVLLAVGPARSLGRHLDSIFPPERVVLRPRAVNLLWLQVETAAITPDVVERVRGIPGVARVSPEATVRFPVRAVGNLAGMQLSTDIALSGVEGWVVGEDFADRFGYEPGEQREVPAVVSEYFLDLYNMTMAEANDLPKLSRSAAIGRHFQLAFDQSTLTMAPGSDLSAGEGHRAVDCRIVGLSRNPDLLGLVVPLEAVEHFNRSHGLPGRRYLALHVELLDARHMAILESRLPELGLALREGGAPWRRGYTMVRMAGVAIVALGVLVFVLAALGIFQVLRAMVRERRREIGLFLALGATPVRVARLLVAEMGLSVGVGGLLGGSTVWLLAGLLRSAYAQLRGQYAFLPADLLAFPWWGVVLTVGLCVGLVMGQVWFSTRRACRRPAPWLLDRAPR